jgi:lipopolysaccharide export system permease protein
MAGFACSVITVKSAMAPLAQYLMLAAAIGGSLWIILYSVVVEPPAALMEAIGKLSERLSRLFGRRAAIA